MATMVTAADMAMGMAEMKEAKTIKSTDMAVGKNKATMDTVIKRRLPANPTASKALTRL